jgi:hypothetical protein
MPSTDAPKKQRTDLRKHILHRFKSTVMRARDAMLRLKVTNPLPMSPKRIWWQRGSASCNRKVRSRANSLFYMLCATYCSSTCTSAIVTSRRKHMLPAGWGDTATLMVLSETLDVDTVLYVAPDLRVSSPAVKDTIPKHLRTLVQ